MTTAIVKSPATATQPAKPSALKVMASRINVDPDKLLGTLKNTVFSKASDDEMLALVVVANEYGLNPFLKELYAFPAKGGGIVPIVSVDGWNKMLVRQPDFDGIEFEFADDEAGNPVSCTAIIYVKNRKNPVKITEYFSECRRNTEPWNTMPRRMLRNRTLCQAARMAFGFSGVMNDDEAASVVVDVASQPMPTEPPPKLIVASPSGDTQPSPQDTLQAIVLGAGFGFDDLRAYAKAEHNLKDADSLTNWDEFPKELAARLVKAERGLIMALGKLKG